MNSLRLRLLLWLLIPLALYIGASGWVTWESTQRTARMMQDQDLLASAQVIAGQLHWRDGALSVDIPPAALELFVELPGEQVARRRDHVYYRVQADNGVLLAGLADLPEADFSATAVSSNATDTTSSALLHPVFAESSYKGSAVRRVSVTRAMYDPDTPHVVTVTVAQTVHGRAHRQRELWQPSLHNLLVMLVLTILLAVLGLTMELRPIMRLKREVSALDPANPQPLRTRDVHTEMRPMVQAINQYLQRLNVQDQTRKRFIAAAAHQMRTPLAVMDTQIENAMRDARRAGVDLRLVALRSTARSLSALTAKLLLLAQAESAHATPSQTGVIDLLPLCTHVLEDASAAAHFKEIDLGMEAQSEHAWVAIHPGLAQAMLANLVDNAIRYTQAGGQVTLAISGQDEAIVVSVADDGPGIQAESRERVFEPFHRQPRDGQSGSGLGLAIVREVVGSAHGNVAVGPGLNGRGVSMTVTLPRADDAPAGSG